MKTGLMCELKTTSRVSTVQLEAREKQLSTKPNYQYGHGELLSDVLQSSHVLPGDIRHGGEALPLGRRLHAGQRGLEVRHQDRQAAQVLLRQALRLLQEV